MLRAFLLTVLGAFLLPHLCLGDAKVVQTFTGGDLKTSTATFTVGDKWELIWHFPRPVNLTVRAPDGTLVAGAHGNKGAVYQPKGGTFYVQLEQADISPVGPPDWHMAVVDVSNGTNLSDADSRTFGGTTVVTGADGNPQVVVQNLVYLPPASTTPSGTATPTSTASSNATATPAAPVVKMSADQARAVVLIRGDNAEGTGFLVKTADGPFVVTNIHVIADNPNLKVSTNTGAQIKVLSTRCASDRDLAELAIQDAGYSYLELAGDVSKTAQTGDEVVTPGNSQGGEVMLNTGGKLLGIGPERVEFDNPIYHGNSGGPVFHSQSGKVLGVVTEAIKVRISDDLDKTSFSSRNSAISGNMRYFGLRLDTVPSWITLDQRRFDIEAQFLDQFHEQSRALDAYLNTDKDHIAPEVAALYHKNERIMKANDSYVQQVGGADASQQFDALKNLIFDIEGVADQNYDQIQNANNFYSFNQPRAQDEMEYRKALRAELASIGNNLDRWKGSPHHSSGSSNQ